MTKRILIVDDDPVLREIAVEVLTSAGFQCAIAGDGAAGLRQVAEFSPDLVLLDMVMPVMDGIETLSALRADWPDLPVAVMSAGTRSMSSAGLLRIASGLGAHEVLQKPLRAATLLPVVERLLAAGLPDALKA
jgi:CheY-like chemotaxis protein